MSRSISHRIDVVAFALVATAACAGTARSPDAYRTETQKVLETRNDRIKSCYDAALKDNATVGGKVAIRFVVEKKTGAFAKATIDPDKSTAPEPVVMCVLNAVIGLRLEPPDANEGQATFVYELKPTSPG